MKQLSTIRAVTLAVACMLSACRTNDSETIGLGDDPPEPAAEAQLKSKLKGPKKQQESLGPDVPSIKEHAECGDVKVKTCKSYRITLLGDPNNNIELRKKYKAAFGEACYMSATNAFGCLITHAVDCEGSD